MGIPFNYTKEISTQLPGDSKIEDYEIIKAYKEKLIKLKAKNIKTTDNSISFKGGLFRFVTNWNLLVPITRGKIRIQRKHNLAIVFDIKFTEMLVIVTLMVSLFFGPILLSEPRLNIFEALSSLFFVWLWLFGGNVVIIMIRFPSFIRKTINAHLGHSVFD
jgi:hypothetical protein